MKRLVTEAELRKLPRGARVTIDRDTLVTPAARDYALWSGVLLVDANAPPAAKACCCAGCAATGSSCGASPAACGGGVALPKLGEGDWLVEVRGGALTVRRIAP